MAVRLVAFIGVRKMVNRKNWIGKNSRIYRLKHSYLFNLTRYWGDPNPPTSITVA